MIRSADEEELRAIYLSALYGKRSILVFDNVLDMDQISQLIPASVAVHAPVGSSDGAGVPAKRAVIDCRR